MRVILFVGLVLLSGEAWCETCAISQGEEYCYAEEPAGCGYIAGVYSCTGEPGYAGSTPLPSPEESSPPGVYDGGIRDGVQWLSDQANSVWSEGEPGPLGRALNWFVERATVRYFEIQIWAIRNAWDIAHAILEDVGVFSALSSAWSGLSADALAVLSFFGIPQALNILLNAALTRWVLRMVPWL